MSNTALRREKSTLCTDAGVGQDFQRDLGALGPYEFQGKNSHRPMVPSPYFQGNSYRPMVWKVRLKFSLYWSMDGSSQPSEAEVGGVETIMCQRCHD